MKKVKYILLAVLALALLVTAGCDPNNEKGTPNGSSASVSGNAPVSAGSAPSSAAQKEPVKNMEIKVYYPDDQGMKLVAVKRKVKTNNSGKYTAAIKSLMEGTKEKGQSTIIPKQAKLKGVTVKGDTAYVDFSQELVKYFTGGSTGEEMLVGSVVNTLTEFSEIKKVQILIEGNKVESLGGHVDLSVPMERMSSLLK